MRAFSVPDQHSQLQGQQNAQAALTPADRACFKSPACMQVSPTRATGMPRGQALAQLEDLLDFHRKAVAVFRPTPEKTGSKRRPGSCLCV